MRLSSVFHTLAAAAFICTALSLPAQAQHEMEGETPAMEQPQQGDYTGTAMEGGFIGQNGNTPAPAPEASRDIPMPVAGSDAPPALPPVFEAVKEAEQSDDGASGVADPCADFADSYDGYNMCQDRIKKIERMREAKQRRMGTTPAPAATAKEEAEPEDDSKKAVKKVEELEKKMKESEEAAAAKKAAPTTKKGIGEFNRNPEKGESVFGK